MTVTRQRRQEVAALLAAVPAWARERPDLRAVGLAGSWARDAARPDSDVDLILITDDPVSYTAPAAPPVVPRPPVLPGPPAVPEPAVVPGPPADSSPAAVVPGPVVVPGSPADSGPVVVRGPAEWMAFFGGEIIRTQQWGPLLTERRLRRPSGLEIELGITTPAWAATTPVDPGTRRVVTDGFRILHDPAALLTALTAACAP